MKQEQSWDKYMSVNGEPDRHEYRDECLLAEMNL